MIQSQKPIEKIRRRDGSLADFEQNKITNAIFKALSASGQESQEISEKVSKKVVDFLQRRFREDQIPEVEQVQDIIEEVLMLEELVEAAKAFILYREQRRVLRETEVISDEAIEIFEKYIGEMDWQVKENANMAYSLQGLNHYAVSVLTRRYWLNKIYPKYIRDAYTSGEMHIHDLDCLATYCNGWDLYDLLLRGFGGVASKVETSPAKHFRVALGQVVNFFYTIQGECFSKDTQVLTDSGWKYFYDVDKSDKIFTLNNQTNRIEIQAPLKFYEFDYNGELYNFKTKKLDLMVTPNHNMVVDQYCPGCSFSQLSQFQEQEIEAENGSVGVLSQVKKQVFAVQPLYYRRFVKAKDFNANQHFIPKQSVWVGEEKEFFELPSIEIKQYRNFGKIYETIKIDSKKILINDWIAFFGFFLAEGNAYKRIRKREGGKLYHEYCVRIFQNQGQVSQDFETILQKLPFNYRKKITEDKITFEITDKQLFSYLEQFGKAGDKFIPSDIKNLPIEQLKVLFDWMMKGDGHIGNGLVEYSTKSKKLADDFQEIVLKLGWSANIYKRIKGEFSWFDIGVSRAKHFRFQPESVQKVSYLDKVYCLEVPNHTLYVRRNGKACWSGNSAGAQALSSIDTLLAPFIKYDNLDYTQVKQAMQEFLFNCAVPTRVGFQTPFSNVTLDIHPSPSFAKQPVIIGGKPQKELYGEFQEEMNMFNNAFFEVMMQGDKNGRPFTFPIPTINITKDFPWDDPKLDLMWQANAKYGISYFTNFIQSDMKPEDVRSMCCRLRLDNKELYKRGGGYFGANPLTGCYDDQTEILTGQGWRFFKDLTKGDEVFTLTDKNFVELHKPNKIFAYDYNGEMYQFKTKSLDLLVTPNHRMVVDQAQSGVRKFVEAQNFDFNNHRIPKQSVWQGIEKDFFILPPIEIFKGNGQVSHFSEEEIEMMRTRREEGSAYKAIANDFNCSTVTVLNICANPNYGQKSLTSYQIAPLSIKMDDWLAFFGFWIAEGSTDNENIALSHGYRTIISQVNQEKRVQIGEVLDRLPFNYNIEKNNFVICNKQLWAYLRQFGKKYDKFIPQEIKGLSKKQLRILFDWMVKGDGHVRKTTGQINYWTASKKLADDLQEVILKLGWLGTMTVQEGGISEIKGRKVFANKCYVLGIQQAKHYRLREESIKKVFYQGKVYCCEVENHTVFVRRNGRVSWCGNSIGVVTINLPRIGYLTKTKKEFFEKLGQIMDVARDSLEIKRKALEDLMKKGLYPYSRVYLAGIEKMRGKYLGNHFSTIGLVGLNESLLNFMGEDIGSKSGRSLALEVLDFMRDRIIGYQKETDNLFNLEATPAEGTSHKLALKDQEKCPGIMQAGTSDAPYYTNSSQLPVNYTDDIFKALELQDELQCKYTGGTVQHLFLGEQIADIPNMKALIKKIFENFHLPYITLTPTFSICPSHGYLSGEHWICPNCTIEQPCEVYSRVVGYIRPVQQWHKGKAQEFKERKTFQVPQVAQKSPVKSVLENVPV